MRNRPSSFVAAERHGQSDYFASEFDGKTGFRGARYRLLPEHRHHNLCSPIREKAAKYFGSEIAWHTHANHALSSQVCCLNFLMPLAERPDVLATLVAAALKIAPPKMLEVEQGPDGRPWFVGFEWNGRVDYLQEAKRGVRTRGANSTSADAVVRFVNASEVETLLIEWKYTESYGPPINPKGNGTRKNRYQHLAFSTGGPIRSDLGLTLEDFFYEPFYQLLRQQMLAFQMQLAGEDGTKRVRVLHIAPAANVALRKVTSPKFRAFGEDAFAAFSAVLVNPTDFISVSTERLFGPIVHKLAATDEWASYLAKRYTFLPASV